MPDLNRDLDLLRDKFWRYIRSSKLPKPNAFKKALQNYYRAGMNCLKTDDLEGFLKINREINNSCDLVLKTEHSYRKEIMPFVQKKKAYSLCNIIHYCNIKCTTVNKLDAPKLKDLKDQIIEEFWQYFKTNSSDEILECKLKVIFVEVGEYMRKNAPPSKFAHYLNTIRYISSKIQLEPQDVEKIIRIFRWVYLFYARLEHFNSDKILQYQQYIFELINQQKKTVLVSLQATNYIEGILKAIEIGDLKILPNLLEDKATVTKLLSDEDNSLKILTALVLSPYPNSKIINCLQILLDNGMVISRISHNSSLFCSLQKRGIGFKYDKLDGKYRVEIKRSVVDVPEVEVETVSTQNNDLSVYNMP
jgi:hypothetical protein